MPRQVDLGQMVPNIQIGTTTTGLPSTNASVVNVGTDLNPILNFTIPRGDPGAINLLIVNELPLIGSDDTMYFVPKQDTETSDLYDEYIWLDNQWELVGEKQITVDLSDYVKNTDYATANKGGVVKTGHQFTLDENNKAQCNTYNYSNYSNAENNTFVSKGTLENVITGKDLTAKAYVDGLVGDIGTILDNINGEVIGG